MASRQPPPRHVEELNRTTEHDLNATASDEEKRGVIGSVIKTVKDTYENARESIVGKRDPADNPHTTTQIVHVYDDNDGVSTGGEVRDISANKLCGIYDSTTQKSNEYADYAGEKAKEAKEKAGEYKDCAVEKAREGKDATVNKLGEYKDYTAEKAKQGKDSAVDATKRAMGYLGDKKEETKEKTADTAEAAKQKTVEAKDKTKEMLSGGDEEARKKAEGENVKDEVLGGKTWRRGNEGVIKIEDTRTGAVAEKLKASDQMTGQTFNDVGPLDDEGVIRVGLLDIKK